MQNIVLLVNAVDYNLLQDFCILQLFLLFVFVKIKATMLNKNQLPDRKSCRKNIDSARLDTGHFKNDFPWTF